MSDFATGYQPEDYGKQIEDGDYRLKIKDIESGFAKSSGAPMLTVELAIEGAKFTVKHRLVKNEYFNGNATKFFDCFKIPRGSFDYPKWIGRHGKGRLEKGEKGYMELKYLIVEPAPNGPQATKPPAAQPPRSQYPAQEPASYTPPQHADGFIDDIPF